MRKFFTVILMVLLFPFLFGFYTGSVPEKGEEQAEVKIIMYHNIAKKNHGKFVISPEGFKKDLEYIKQNGYTPVGIADLIAFVYDSAPLPEKPIVLSFDDGSYGVYKYAYPLLKENNMKAVMSIIGAFTDKYSDGDRKDINYPNFTWNQVNEMLLSGLIEFQNHSYNLHSGAGACRINAESETEYEKRLRNDLERMQRRTKEMTGITPQAFTYPFGRLSKNSERIIKGIGFRASLSCFEGVNVLKHGDYECLFALKRYNRPNNKPLSAILK